MPSTFSGTTTMHVTVKWTTQKYTVDLDVKESPLIFKNQLFSLTGVAPERQKLVLKGAQIKDNDDWTQMKHLKEGALFLLMGTAGELPKAPEKPTVFMEDLSHGEVAKSMNIPIGLTNLGNTCYMNATLQCLRQVRELQTYLEQDAQNYGTNPLRNIAVSFRELYKQLDAASEAVPPLAFLTTFRSAFPQFAQQDSHGVFAQQDAEEAWNQLLTSLKMATSRGPAEGPNGPPAASASTSNASTSLSSAVEKYLGIRFENVSTCEDPDAVEAGDVPTTTESTDLRITCHISNQVNNVHQSIVEGLEHSIEKTSDFVGRPAVYTVKAHISRLPKYLTIHFARFFWRSDIRKRVKIRRNVAFAPELDMYQYCVKDLQAKLSCARDKGEPHPDLAKDDGCNPSGVYELCAMLTHIGASSDSGHYIGWVKEKDGWCKFDDDKVSPVKEADVLKNSGSSADGHIAYLLLYRSKEVKKEETQEGSSSSS